MSLSLRSAEVSDFKTAGGICDTRLDNTTQQLPVILKCQIQKIQYFLYKILPAVDAAVTIGKTKCAMDIVNL